MEGAAMNTCLHVLKLTQWILSFKRVDLKFIEYFPDYLSALSRTLLRFFWTTFVETALNCQLPQGHPMDRFSKLSVR